MDIARKDQNRGRKRKVVMGSLLAFFLVVATGLLMGLEPAPPRVEASTIRIGEVTRGELVRKVRGAGRLVPITEQVISAELDAVVERIVVLPGDEVEVGQVLLELANPEIEQRLMEAETRLAAAKAELEAIVADTAEQSVDRQAAAASVASALSEARLRLAADERLAEEGLLPDISLELSRIRAAELESRLALELRRVEVGGTAGRSRVAAARTQIEERQALVELRRNQSESQIVRAALDGVLREVPVEIGERVSSGDVLARIAETDLLKAEIEIPEAQARDLELGQSATIETWAGSTSGHLVRIDPAVSQGTVTVDVRLQGSLPRGSRPDLTVDGVIEIERLVETLKMPRPGTAQSNTEVRLLLLDDDGKSARRVEVKLGRLSVNEVEILAGLEVGDRIVLSESNPWRDADRIRIE